jgi:exodeoxyribonuclease V alpha subunit
MTKIRCVVERITYQNPENGYSVIKCRVKDYSDLVTVLGNLLDVNVGSVLLVDGNWKVDPKYGRQFVAENWEETLPATVYGMKRYLGSGLIKGVGSEYPIVVMPVTMSHYIMLQRNLIYTGITRAKKVMVVLGSQKALSMAVKKVVITKRNTMLRERLAR